MRASEKWPYWPRGNFERLQTVMSSLQLWAASGGFEWLKSGSGCFRQLQADMSTFWWFKTVLGDNRWLPVSERLQMVFGTFRQLWTAPDSIHRPQTTSDSFWRLCTFSGSFVRFGWLRTSPRQLVGCFDRFQKVLSCFGQLLTILGDFERLQKFTKTTLDIIRQVLAVLGDFVGHSCFGPLQEVLSSFRRLRVICNSFRRLRIALAKFCAAISGFKSNSLASSPLT